MTHKTPLTHLLIIMALSLLLMGNSAQVNKPVVHAVLFYSDTCPHCHKVITEDLPPLVDKFGEQLIIIGINMRSVKVKGHRPAILVSYQCQNAQIYTQHSKIQNGSIQQFDWVLVLIDQHETLNSLCWLCSDGWKGCR